MQIHTLRRSFLPGLALAALACGSPPSSATPPTPADAPAAALPTDTLPADTLPADAVLDAELRTLVSSDDVSLALAVVLDARTGRILAMQSVSDDGVDPEAPARDRLSHGSVGKTFTYAIALDRGALAPGDDLDGTPLTVAGETISDRELHGTMSVEDAIAFSSNVGAARAFERLGREPLLSGLGALHLDATAADDAAAVRLAYGPGLEVTPLQIASAFAAVVNGGTYHAAWRDGEAPTRGEPVLSADTSAEMRALLEAAVVREDATGHRALLATHRVGGKTGTMPLEPGADGVAGTRGCFAGAVPIDDPAYVVVVNVTARTSEYSGGTLAAPAFARIADRLMVGAPARTP